MYNIPRHLDKILQKSEFSNKVIAITGARQTGKSTLLKHHIGNMPQITFDNQRDLLQAKTEPATFIKDNKPPLFIDEVQYATEIFPYIKIEVDNSEDDGQYFLTGSQKFNLMENLTESLAGRVSIFELLGLSLREINRDDFNEPFMPTTEYYEKRKDSAKEPEDIWRLIHTGSYPEINDRKRDWNKFYSDYVQTYLERDVRRLSQVGDLMKFQMFMQVAASHIGQMINYSSIARDVGVTEPTAQKWLSVLAASNIIFLLQPYYNNSIKRAVKTPKLYFHDTGLAAYLSRWETADVLKNGAMNGAYFENFVVCEILKSYYNAGYSPNNFYFFRDKEKHEIDLIIYKNGTLYPIEIKKHDSPDKKYIVNFPFLEKINDVKIGEGAVVNTTDRIYSLTETIKAVPYWYI
jgi:predicted AAA+ superfamily ATPase